MPAQDGDASQYGYDESAQSSVKVYFTLSSDGVPIRGNEDDETVLSHLEVEVPYFDLGLYGLEDYYRYTTDESSSYVGDKAIERPTALHLYIYMIERYYMGLPEDQCCKGTSGVLSYTGSGDGVYNMYGDIAYEDSLSALNITGSATSMYMQNFWGHDENLMYYRNHVYPLQRAGWGSTADYILLSDNDTIDVAMFTNWSFYNYGAFACFGDGNTTTPINSTTAAVGETLTLQTLKYDTKSSVQGGNEGFETISDLALEVYNEDWECISKAAPDEDGKYEVKFSKAGKYHVIAIDPNCGGEDACYAPATVEVTVSDASKEPIMGDLNNDGTVDKNDCLILNSIVNNKTTATEYQESVADVNGDGEINTRDVVRLVSYVNGKITSL